MAKTQPAKSRTVQQLQRLLKEDSGAGKLLNSENLLYGALFSTIPKEEVMPLVASYVNSLLAVPSLRVKGLELLDSEILRCPLPLVLENAASWINICINVSPSKPVNAVNFHVAGKTIKMCRGIQDFDKSMTGMLSKTIELCISTKMKTVENDAGLECLQVCLWTYPSTCGLYKNKVEMYLISFFTSQLSSKTTKLVASCFHALQQVGGSSGLQHQLNWSNQMAKLCLTLNKLYDAFFANETEFTKSNFEDIVGVCPFKIPGLSFNGSNNNLSDSANTIRNTIAFINQMLLEGFPVQKDLSLSQILQVIKRGLALDVYDDYLESLEKTHFVLCLYQVQIDLLYLLRSLIACGKSALMPYSFLITKLLTDCLQRIEKDYFRNNSDYQKAIFKVLEYWITTANNKLHPNSHNKLVELAVSQIIPSTDNASLCLRSKDKQKNNSPVKKSVEEAMPRSSKTAHVSHAHKIKEEVCAQALNTGSVLLQCVALELDLKIRKLLCDVLTRIIVKTQCGENLPPYTNKKCQQGLYRMFVSLFEQPDYCCSPLVQLAANVINRKQVETNSQNNFLVCLQGSSVLEKMFQPICASLYVSNPIDTVPFPNLKKKAPESEDGNSNVSDSCLVSLVDESVINAPERNESSAVGKSKINILNVHVIKQAGVNQSQELVSKLEQSKNPAESDSQLEETVLLADLYKDNEELGDPAQNMDGVIETVVDIKKNIEDMSQESNSMTELMNQEVNLKQEVLSSVSIDIDSPLAKKVKIECEDEMLSDFMDVVNEY